MTAKPPPAPRPLTREQFHELDRLGYFNDKRVELIYGEIVEMSPVNWPHALCVNLVIVALARAFPVGFWVASQQPIAIPRAALASQPQPDAAVITGSIRDYTDHPTTAALLVEVSDSTLSEDLTTKAELYATAGIADYWVLDIPNRQLHVFRAPQPLHTALGGAAYQAHLILAPTDTVNPLAAPSVSVLVSDLLP